MTISDSSEVPLAMDATNLCDFYSEHPKYQDLEGDHDGRQCINKKIYIRMCDITTVKTDVMVCPTQTNLRAPPYGLCVKVWQRGGLNLKQTCWERERLEAGTSFVAKGYGLPTKNVIFTVGLAPDAPYNYEERLEILGNNYKSSLEIIREREDIRTVAFPCLGTGGGGLDTSDANRVAVRAIREFLEQQENRDSVDVILLCMFSEEQWSEYLPELLKAFPYGLDLQGYDHEAMSDIQSKHLALPPCSISTNILGYKYEPTATKIIKRHFHRIVDQCLQRLHYAVTLKSRFCNCVILTQKGNCEHQVTILHSEAISMVEVQVTRFSDHAGDIRADICQDLYLCISEYFKMNLDNITSFEYYLRCHQTLWGCAAGLWKYSEVAALSKGRQTCDKHELSQDYHQFLPCDMLQNWRIMAHDLSQGDLSPQGYHISRVNREPDEHSLSSQSSESGTQYTRLQQQRPPSLSYWRSVEEGSLSPSTSCTPSSAGWSVPDTPTIDETQWKQPLSPDSGISSVISQPQHKEKGRNKELCGQTEKCLVSEDHEKETRSRGSSGDKSRIIRSDTLCRDLKNPDLLKLAKQMGSYQKRVGLYLSVPEADIEIAISEAKSDPVIQGFNIIRKWMKMKGKEADICSLLEAYHECDIDIYPIKQQFGIK